MNFRGCVMDVSSLQPDDPPMSPPHTSRLMPSSNLWKRSPSQMKNSSSITQTIILTAPLIRKMPTSWQKWTVKDSGRLSAALKNRPGRKKSTASNGDPSTSFCKSRRRSILSCLVRHRKGKTARDFSRTRRTGDRRSSPGFGYGTSFFRY